MAVTGPRIWRTWTLREDVKVPIQSGGQMSFREGGTVDADFVRAEGDVAVLKLIDGNNAFVPIASLSDADQEVLKNVAGVVIDERRLDRAIARQKAQLAANDQAIAEAKARAEAQQIARFNKEQAEKAEADRLEEIRRSLEPQPYFPGTRLPMEQVRKPDRQLLPGTK